MLKMLLPKTHAWALPGAIFTVHFLEIKNVEEVTLPFDGAIFKRDRKFEERIYLQAAWSITLSSPKTSRAPKPERGTKLRAV